MIRPQQIQTESTTPLLTITETAEFLGCSRANVYALIDVGDLPVISIGKSRGYRVDRRDLENFLQIRKKQKAAVPVKLPRLKLKHIRLP
jgi:excisionase family DNA binding protein